MTLKQAVTEAIEHAKQNGMDIPADLMARAYNVGALKAASDLASINAYYRDVITEALTRYFEGGAVAALRNLFKRGMVEAFGAAFDLGWRDGGGTPPPDADALSWFNARVDAEFGHIGVLFTQIKELRKDTEFDYFQFVTARADGYVSSVAGVYNAGVMFAQKNKMLTWNLGNTEKHCSDCAKLSGGKHRASWYLARNFIPRQPGAAMECGGYKCDCYLTDDAGKVITI